MKIEVLYFEGCPNHKPAIARIDELVKAEGISAEVSEVNVPDASVAQEVGFLGSPSIRVNGMDVEQAARSAREYGMMCRTYVVNGQREGLPSREMILQAIREVQSGATSTDHGCQPGGTPETPIKISKNPSLFAAGSVVAAIVASFCCILPIVFALTGFSILGASALFDAWRPYLLGLTFGLLGLGFFFSYRPRKEQCAPGSTCAMPATNRSGRLMLWLATAAVILFAVFPYYSGPVAELLLSGSFSAAAAQSGTPKLAHASFAIQGIDCTGCATEVVNKLKTVKGVRSVTVSVEYRKAEIDYDPDSTTLSQLEQAIKDAGYDARKV
jgi:copper chaperone CopZ